MSILLECQSLSLGYEGKTVVENVSFALEKGGFLAVLGPNGSGKSTLVQGLLGLIKPHKGRIIWQDKSKKATGYLPQKSTVPKDFPASVLEVVLLGGVSKKNWVFRWLEKEKKAAFDLLEWVGMSREINTSFQALSEGQQQRVLLARALMASQDILILDEPVSGLDPEVTEDLYQRLEILNRNRQVSIIMVSQDRRRSLALAKQVLYVNRQGWFGSVEEYRQTDFYKKELEDV